jgi:hypothetical protein
MDSLGSHGGFEASEGAHEAMDPLGSHGVLEASGIALEAVHPLGRRWTWIAYEAMQPLGSHVGLKFLRVHMKLRIRSIFCT